ncbi:MAG: D-aminoacyl-tRNA deacylase [Spirochaetota bacterium]|nr:D-aminoacyl-tRNA deacylase [Spirochaetota bacterium]
MRAVIQRVRQAELHIDGELHASIDKGIVALVAVGNQDETKDIQFISDKILNLRIFPDENDSMNLSLTDVGGDLMIVSQFTLYGDCRKGRRPSYSNAMSPESAREIYEGFLEHIRSHKGKVVSGRFQAMMDVTLCNWGPVTLLLDSKKTF